MHESIILKVNGITREEGENTIHSKLKAFNGIRSAHASHENQEVKVTYDTDVVSLGDIILALQDGGFEVVQE